MTVEAEHPYIHMDAIVSVDDHFNQILDTEVDDSILEQGRGI